MGKLSGDKWLPSTSTQNLKARAEIVRSIREFFYIRDVMEVETPLLSQATVTDVHLDGIQATVILPNAMHHKLMYLQTSPEFAMKRLLCAGVGDIYQISKAFRNDELGRCHNPEFTMLEWYRVGYSSSQLMTEIEGLVCSVLKLEKCVYQTYQQAFLEHLNIDPLSIDDATLKQHCIRLGYDNIVAAEPDRDTLLQLLFCEKIEPVISLIAPCFITHFPASQASLAKIDKHDCRVAHRFELYYQGIELANGFDELQDASEQRTRFEADNELRRKVGLSAKPIDELFLAALTHGLPHCSGVALGVDRLVMLSLNKKDITEVLSFDFDRA